MNWTEYRTECARTAWPGITDEYLRLGLIGEVGEVVELVKKSLRPGRELDRERVAEECGDVLWYVAMLWEDGWPPRREDTTLYVSTPADHALGMAFCAASYVRGGRLLNAIIARIEALTGQPWQDLAAANVAKLRARHPNGWTS